MKLALSGFARLSLSVAIAVAVPISQPIWARSLPQVNEALSLTQINLRWFGNENMAETSQSKDNIATESRVKSIRQHLAEQKLLSDVMVFEEIVDVNLLTEGVLENKYRCHSYSRSDENHQYVVVCVKSHFRFDRAPGEKSYALEAVDVSGGLRPAVHGIVKNQAGESILHVFAVHLKAAPEYASTRLKQMGIIADYIKFHDSRLPVVIVGDFNTYGDDAERISSLLETSHIEEIPSPEPYSWASSREEFPRSKFDRTWLSSDLVDKVTMQNVLGPCSDADLDVIQDYNRRVSDHCAVKTVVALD